MRRLLPLLACLAAGCASPEPGGRFIAKEVQTGEVSPETQRQAARVDRVGQDLVSQNPFLGVDPTFSVVGKPGLELYHPDEHGILISEALAAKCSDDELAAVLATELAIMSSEHKAARRMALPEPMHTLPDGGAMGAGPDPSQLAAQAIFDKPLQKAARRSATESPRAVAVTILQNAQIDKANLDKVGPLVEEAKRAAPDSNPLGNRPRAPTWTP